MLHAFSHGKSRLYRRYLGEREAGEQRVCEEDEITSLIMGPLDYLPAEAAGIFWRALIEPVLGREGHFFPTGPVTHSHMRFWPRKGIEPDLLVELRWSAGERRLLLVEFKWNAPLSGDDQLHRQWLEFLTQTEREEALHVFIGPDISSGLNAVGKYNCWGERLILLSWTNVLDVLHRLKGSRTTGLERWSYHASAFLNRLDIRRFQGFIGLIAPVQLPGQAVFWKPLNGFAQLQPPATPLLDTQQAPFLRSSHHE